MIIYVNGDSHSAGAEAMNPHCFAEDDPMYQHLGRKPHPDNLYVSYGCMVANNWYGILDCDAESASSNDRIIRTTEEYLKSNNPDIIIIGWATWEREEFLIDGEWYQFTGGIQGEPWPKHIMEQYKQWVVTANPADRADLWHNRIYDLHQQFKERKLAHLFFNTYSAFNHSFITPKDWGDNYIDPYNQQGTFYHWLKAHGYDTVNPNSYHFGPDAHRAWAEYLINHLTKSLT